MLAEAEITTLHPALIRMRRLLPGIRSRGLHILLRTLRRFSSHPGSFQTTAWPDLVHEPGRLFGFDPFDWALLITGMLFGLLILFL